MPRFDVYGRFLLDVERSGDGWVVWHVGQGLRRPAEDIRLPPSATLDELADHLDVLLHEYAGPGGRDPAGRVSRVSARARPVTPAVIPRP